MLIDRYQQAVTELLEKVKTTQRENIIKAGEIVAEASDIIQPCYDKYGY